jgi:hypothetical protein
MTKIPLILCTLFAFAIPITGCVAPQVAVQQEILPTSRILPYSKDKVWETVLRAVQKKNLIVKVLDKESGLIIFEASGLALGYANRGQENYFYTPQIFLGVWNGAQVRPTVIVRKIDANQTSIEVINNYSAFESNVTKSWHTVKTNGKAESKFIDDISLDLIINN